MDLAAKISEVRKNGGLTQDEFAEKLFVTRQAVSRWETGETTPTVDTLKTICDLFKIDANDLLGTENPLCQSCGMNLSALDDISANKDKSANLEYCRYCFENGKFVNDVTLEEAVEINLQYLDDFNAKNGTSFSVEEARVILKEFLPTLKRWKV